MKRDTITAVKTRGFFPLVRNSALLIGVICLVATSNSFADPLSATYNFNSVAANAGGTTDPTPVPTATGLTFGSFTAVGTGLNPNAGGRFSFTNNVLGSVNGNDNFATFTGSLDLGKYFEVTLTPDAAYSLDLDTISFTLQRSGTGIRSYAVRSSVDNFGANLPASISPANTALTIGPGNEFRVVSDATATAQNGSLITLGSGFDALTGPVTFRFYAWNAEAITGTFSIDNVVFTGAITPVPEPSTYALLSFGALAGMALLARRKS